MFSCQASYMMNDQPHTCTQFQLTHVYSCSVHTFEYSPYTPTWKTEIINCILHMEAGN